VTAVYVDVNDMLMAFSCCGW